MPSIDIGRRIINLDACEEQIRRDYEKRIIRNDVQNNFTDCAKYIKENLNCYINNYVVPEMKPFIYIAGGSIATLIDGYLSYKKDQCLFKKPEYGDIDFWLKEIPSKDSRRKQYKNLKECEQYDSSQEYPEGMGIRKAFTFMLSENNHETGFKSFQFIAKFIGDPRANVGRFDFEHCKPIYDVETEKLFISEEQIYSILNKKLLPIPMAKISIDKFLEFDKMPSLIKDISEDDMGEAKETLKRVTKYYKRGYRL